MKNPRAVCITDLATLIMLVVRAEQTAAHMNWLQVRTQPEKIRRAKTSVNPGAAAARLVPILAGSPITIDTVRNIGRVLKLFTWSISTVER